MIKYWRLKLARWMIRRRTRPVRFVTALATWLPFWCLPIAATLYWGPGFAVLLVLPVLVVGRYFVARRVADSVVGKIYDIVRLRQPLAQTLRRMGEFEPGLVGVRLETIGELLEQGLTLGEALRLALPEIQRNRLGAIAAAESQGRLLSELAQEDIPSDYWNIFTELDTSMLVYIILLTIAFVFVVVLALPRYDRLFYQFGIAVPRVGILAGRYVGFWVLFFFVAPPMVGGVLLRRLAVPFFQRADWFLFCRDVILWRLPILGRMVRSQSWAAATYILAGAADRGIPLHECCNLAAVGVANWMPRHRLRRWGRLMANGMDPSSAAKKARVPRLIRQATITPLGDLTGSSLRLASQIYRNDFLRTMAWVRAASIPVGVLAAGLLVLAFLLAIYLPYSWLLAALCRSIK